MNNFKKDNVQAALWLCNDSTQSHTNMTCLYVIAYAIKTNIFNNIQLNYNAC